MGYKVPSKYTRKFPKVALQIGFAILWQFDIGPQKKALFRSCQLKNKKLEIEVTFGGFLIEGEKID